MEEISIYHKNWIFTQINHLEGESSHTSRKETYEHTVSRLHFKHLLDNIWKVPISPHRLHNVSLDWKSVDGYSIHATMLGKFHLYRQNLLFSQFGSWDKFQKDEKEAGRQWGWRYSAKLSNTRKYPWLVQRLPGATYTKKGWSSNQHSLHSETQLSLNDADSVFF